MLTIADARTYCLTVAQIIPALLIAVFVLERRSPIFTHNASMLPQLREFQEDISKSAEDFRGLEQSYASDIDILERELDRLSQFTERSLSAKQRRNLHEARAGIAKQLKAQRESRSRVAELAIRAEGDSSRHGRELDRFDSGQRAMQRNYALGVVGTIIIAMLGEIIALLGSLGLIAAKLGILLSTYALIAALLVLVIAAVLSWAIETEVDIIFTWTRRILVLIAATAIIYLYALLSSVTVANK